MKYILYLFAYSILWCISILPFPLLYLLSDIISFILYRIVGYRKKVVRSNLKLAFPDYTDDRRLEIEKAFYKYMCDMFLEMIKTMTIDRDDIFRRYHFTNIEVIRDYEKKGKSIILMCSHYASWEWVIILDQFIKNDGYGIYKKISNPYFDKLAHKIRSRFNGKLVDTKHTVETIRRNEQNGINASYLFISDQAPKLSKKNYWSTFMGVDTPIHTGAEKLAKDLDMNVLYLKVSKIKRGFYEAEFIEITDNAKAEPDFYITEKFLRIVEEQIKTDPRYYFWTHKRWKYTR